MWVAPDGRSLPKITVDDVVKMLPVAFCAMGSHCASVFALNAGATTRRPETRCSLNTA
jgi:solute carrier family 35 protein E1